MTNTRIKTNRVPEDTSGQQSAILTANQQAVMGITGLTDWKRGSYGVDRGAGFRWRSFNRQTVAEAYDRSGPVSVTAAGKAGLQFGYGDTLYTGTNRGAVTVNSDLLGVSGWSSFIVCRVPTVASAETALPGGYVWRGAYGPGDNTNPGFVISQSTGRPNVIGGNKSVTNPLHAGASVDCRDSLIHLFQLGYNGAADLLKINMDKNYASGTATAATLDPDTTTYPDILKPIIGVYVPIPVNFINYFQGQIYDALFFNQYVEVGSADALKVEAMVVEDWGVTLTP